MKIHLRDSAVPLSRSVQYVECLIVPSAARGIAGAGIAALSDDPPNGLAQEIGRQSLESVDQPAIAANARHGLEVRVRIQTVQYLQNFNSPVRVDKIERPLAVELRVTCVEPRSYFVVIIIVAQAAHDIRQIRQNQFVARLWFDITRSPPRYRRF